MELLKSLIYLIVILYVAMTGAFVPFLSKATRMNLLKCILCSSILQAADLVCFGIIFTFVIRQMEFNSHKTLPIFAAFIPVLLLSFILIKPLLIFGTYALFRINHPTDRKVIVLGMAVSSLIMMATIWLTPF